MHQKNLAAFVFLENYHCFNRSVQDVIKDAFVLNTFEDFHIVLLYTLFIIINGYL